jgi:two-component system NtrC family response regulator
VLLLGESGTGKELFAKGVHVLSGRAEGPFIAINCAAIPDNLLESELFGHEQGSFTGALRQQLGKIEMASGGTLFLDEIGDLPLGLQAKLLRFLQERSIERVGGRKSIPVDIRVVSATNRNLAQLIEHEEFREDLYFRLAEAVIQIPPLRQRPEDIFLLAHHFLSAQAQAEGRTVQGFAPDALTALSSYGWPGNVRELENRVKRAVVAATGKQVVLEDLGLPVGDAALTGCTLKESRERADRLAIIRALVEAKGNISKASRILDISRPTLYQLLREYDIRY